MVNLVPNPVNVASTWAAIRSLAPERFDAYKRHGDADELDAVCRYLWNIAVCRELQGMLHNFEVTFRNQVHNSLSTHKGTPTWYDLPNFLSLDEQSAVIRTKKNLERQKRVFAPGRVVAELNFGFWTGLYGKAHEQDIVRPTIRQVFPGYIGAIPLQRSVIASSLKEARTLRNRVSHHEHVAFDPKLAITYGTVKGRLIFLRT